MSKTCCQEQSLPLTDGKQRPELGAKQASAAKIKGSSPSAMKQNANAMKYRRAEPAGRSIRPVFNGLKNGKYREESGKKDQEERAEEITGKKVR